MKCQESSFTLPKQNYQLKLKFTIMGNLLYLVAVVLIILWIIGFFFHGFGDVGGFDPHFARNRNHCNRIKIN
jgi:hypothetical protein